MAKDFHADFYITCATVIPVLYLALVVQGGTYEMMLKAASRATSREPKRQRDYVAAALLPSAAYLTLASAVLGELNSLLVLFGESDYQGARIIVLICMLILIAAASAVPAARWFTVQWKLSGPEPRRSRPDSGNDSAKGAAERPETST